LTSNLPTQGWSSTTVSLESRETRTQGKHPGIWNGPSNHRHQTGWARQSRTNNNQHPSRMSTRTTHRRPLHLLHKRASYLAPSRAHKTDTTDTFRSFSADHVRCACYPNSGTVAGNRLLVERSRGWCQKMGKFILFHAENKRTASVPRRTALHGFVTASIHDAFSQDCQDHLKPNKQTSSSPEEDKSVCFFVGPLWVIGQKPANLVRPHPFSSSKGLTPNLSDIPQTIQRPYRPPPCSVDGHRHRRPRSVSFGS